MVNANTPNTKRAWLNHAIELKKVEWTIRKTLENETNKDTVTVLAMPAGTGKSAYIRDLIADGNEGLIVVTDRISQATKYFEYREDNGDKAVFENDNAILLTNNNLAETMPIAPRKAILVMTMARFFQMSREDIIALSHWKHGKRTKVIIDEQPPVIEQSQVKMETLDMIHSAIWESIDDEANQSDKEWCLKEWKLFCQRMESKMVELERKYSPTYEQFYVWFDDNLGQITEDDSRFMRFIQANEKSLTMYGKRKNTDIIASINHVYRLIIEGGLYSCRLKRTGEYETSFTVVQSNVNKLTHLIDENGDGLKVFILDGTADISPDYNQYGIDVWECQHYYRDLSNLTINILDINTSKYAMSNLKTESEELQEIKKYIQRDSIVFSYMDYVRTFESCVDNPDEQLAYFGAIRGRNDFNQRDNFVQIGLNRFPPAYYLMLHRMMKGNREYYDALFDEPENQYIAELNRIIKGNILKSDSADIRRTAQEIHRIMEMSLLCDIEQNVFRSSIRNYQSNKPVIYTLVFDVKAHTELIMEIRKRFESHGAHINVIDRPLALRLKQTEKRKAPQGQQKTNAQKILEYIDHVKVGSVFKLADLLKTTGITNKQLDKLKTKNKAIAEKLKQMQTDKKGYYIKK